MAAEGEGPAFLCMTVIGIGYLFPISAVWAAFDYWKVLFPDINIEFVVTGVYQTGSMFTVMFLMLAKSFSLGPRILGGFCGQFVCLAMIFAFRWLPVTRDALFYVLLVVILFCSVATGYLDSAILSLCSQYSPRMQQFLQIGIGLGTVVSVLYRDTTKLLMSRRGVADATSMYFAAALATVLICVACYRLLMSLPVSKAVLAGEAGYEVTTWNSPPPLACNFASPTPAGRLRTDSSDRANSLLEAEQQEVANDEALADFTTVWPRVRINQSVAFLNLFLTTLCYPGLITSIPCRQFTALRAEHWFQTLLLTAFTLADILGRFLTDERLGRAGLHYGNIWMTVVVRATLFPAMLFCIASPNASDGLAVAVVAAFGLLNGFCVSLALMVMNDIPELSAEQRKTCGRISACSVNSGLCVGSLAAAVLAIALGLGS